MKLILFSLIVFISTLAYIDTTEALAFEVSYKPNGIKLAPDPTVCTIEPTESDLTSKEVEKLMKQTKLAVDEWETKLQAETRNNKEGWDFNYIVIDDKNRTNADQSCDITFVFEPKPAIAEKYFTLGISDYDAETQTSLITIYYLEIEECYHTEREGDTIFYWYETCYGEDMRNSMQINAVTKHEFGHAIGLAHYEPDDPEIAELWSKGTTVSPSIMVQIAFDNSKEMQIRDDDIKMLYSIYGDDGFESSENEEDYFELFRVGDYLEKKEYEKLQNYLDEFLKENPENDDANYYQALLHYELKNYQKAIPFLDKSIESQPENDELLYYQARSLYNVEKYAEALPYIERAVEINPDNLQINSRHGVILFELGRYDDALNAYRMALSIDPEDPTTLDRRGQVHHQMGDYEKALTYFDMALDIDPEDKGTLVNKANALFELKKYDDAIEYYERVLDMDSKHLEALKGMAASLENIGDEREAAKYYERISLQDEKPSTNKIIENPINAASSQIPDWIRNNASWWVAGNIDDDAFVGGIQFLIKEGIIQIPETTKSTPSDSQEIPTWIKNNADWWSQGLISDNDFLKGIQFLVENGIIIV
ncbi:MAG: tetratricopeptide repeat protein [Nitrosopumilus sp.]|nr:tetratricopeptide repeat protein [Nitrosopumilus sp.]